MDLGTFIASTTVHERSVVPLPQELHDHAWAGIGSTALSATILSGLLLFGPDEGTTATDRLGRYVADTFLPHLEWATAVVATLLVADLLTLASTRGFRRARVAGHLGALGVGVSGVLASPAWILAIVLVCVNLALRVFTVSPYT